MKVKPSITLDTISKQHSDFELSNISFTAHDSEIISIVGSNGSGKTTLLKILSGAIEPDSGNLTDIPKSKLGVVFDQNHLPLELTIYEYSRILPSLFTNWDASSFKHYIDYFELPVSKKIGLFSKGMLKKFNVSIVLSHSASFLLLDEVTSDLDPFVRDEVLEVIKNYVKKNNAIAIITTHILEDVLTISDSLLVIEHGEMMVKKDTDDFENIEALKSYLKSII